MPIRLGAQRQRAISLSLYRGDLRAVKNYLLDGWDPRAPLCNSNCLLYVHAKAILSMLIRAGVNPNDSFGNEPPLLYHIRRRSLRMVSYLLGLAADVNVSHTNRNDPDLPFGTTPLIAAVNYNLPEIVRRLIQRGADLNLKDEHGHSALWHAAFRSRGEMVKELVKRGAELPEDVLAGPVFDGKVQLVKYLINKGANVNPQNIRRWHKRFDNFETLLGMSIRKIGFFDYPETIAPLLIKAGADVNQRWFNRPPINLAALMGLRKIVRELIKAGADVDAEDTSGNTALGEVAITGRVDLVKLLIAAGANVNHQGREYKTPLEWAWKYGHPEIAKLLETAGSKVKTHDVTGNTALEETIMKGHKLSVEAVIRAGANVNHRGPTGKTPLELAKQCGQEEIVQFLKKFGAKD